MEPHLISIVVPVCNEQDALEALTREIREVADRNQYRLQIVFVDDGSRDASWERIRRLASENPDIGGLRFRRNEGKAAALMAGFAVAAGDVVFMMDADLQDPPSEMPRLLAKLAEGWDVVSGWKQQRHDPWHKVYPSRVFNRMISFLTGVHLHDHVCGLKCFRGEVIREIHLHGEFHRFLGVLAAARGFRVTEIPTLHRARTTGAGKYGFTRFTKGFFDLLTVWMLTRYRWRPQHVIGTAGIAVMLAGALALLPGLGRVLAPALSVVVPGMIFIAIGLVAEMIAASRPEHDLYTVIDRAGWCAGGSAPGTAESIVV